MDYVNNKCLAYNIIIVPSVECIYETLFAKIFRLRKHGSKSFRELRDFCKRRNIFLVLINSSFSILSQDENKLKILKKLDESFPCYRMFEQILLDLEKKVNYKFNKLVWIDDLNNLERINEFCALSWDTIKN